MKEQNIPLRLFPVTLFSFFGLWGEEWGFRLLCCKFVLWFVFLPWPGHPSLQNVEESLRHVDTTFFLGKVGFLATGGKRVPCLLLPTPAEGSLFPGLSRLLAEAAWGMERARPFDPALLVVFQKANPSRSFCLVNC